MIRIRRKSGQIIETHCINGSFVTLTPFMNTSAPCSNCHFFNSYQLKCTFPEDKQKKCKVETGTTHGWNTIEYTYVVEEAKDEIISASTSSQKIPPLPDSLVSQQTKDTNSQSLPNYD